MPATVDNKVTFDVSSLIEPPAILSRIVTGISAKIVPFANASESYS
jgi:hypothetical protein